MAASITDLISKVTSGTYAAPTTVQTARSSGTTSLLCNALTGWDTTTVQHFLTYRLNGSGALVAGTECAWAATASGNTLSNLTLMAGTDTGNQVGDVVVNMPTHEWARRIASHILTQHNQDGTHAAVTATSLTASGTVQGATLISTGDIQRRSVSTETMDSEHFFDYVASGLVWSGDAYASTLNASMTAGVVYINGQRLAISAVTARAFTASKDTYIDILNTAGVGSIVYTEVANNAASPALAANSIRIGIIVSGANIASVASVNQGQENKVLPIASSIPYAVTDSLGNLICPRDPNRKILGYRQNVVGMSTSSTTYVQVTALSVPVIVPAGRKIKISFFSKNLYNSASNSALISIWDGVVASGTQLAETHSATTAAGSTTPGVCLAQTTPSSASKTYNIGIRSGSASNSGFDASATAISFIQVELA